MLLVDDLVEDTACRIDNARIFETLLQDDDAYARPGRESLADLGEHRATSIICPGCLQYSGAVIDQHIFLDACRMRIIAEPRRPLHLDTEILQIAGSFRQPNPIGALPQKIVGLHPFLPLDAVRWPHYTRRRES